MDNSEEGGCVWGLGVGSGVAVLECIKNVSFSLFKSLLFIHIFSDLSGLLDDVHFLIVLFGLPFILL